MFVVSILNYGILFTKQEFLINLLGDVQMAENVYHTLRYDSTFFKI